MPRYVILEHDHPELHWDFMVQTGAVLRTWRLARPPGAEEMVSATAIADHRLMYLDYEGPVSDGRGNVLRWDAGLYTEEKEGARSLDRVVIALEGKRLIGTVVLEHLQEDRWSFQFCQ